MKLMLGIVMSFLVVTAPLNADAKKVASGFERKVLTYEEQLKENEKEKRKEEDKQKAVEQLLKKNVKQQKEILDELTKQTKLLEQLVEGSKK